MIIVGAGGFAKEVLEVLMENKFTENIAFYDDVTTGLNDLLYDKFKILKSETELKDYFTFFGCDFTIGIGNPMLRKKMHELFIQYGGNFVSTISLSAKVGSFDVDLGEGINILSNAIISNSVKIGKGCIIYYNSIIAHDCKIGNFVEISPSARLLGKVEIGDYSEIGSNSTILPEVKIGNNVIVGAGAVVLNDLPSYSVAVGVPARIIKSL
jgi:sugar O-acyltransferase (sialic acid O-acetyltransferase NeuD family)